MAGNLIIPRVRVTWGDVNLSAYNGKGGFPKRRTPCLRRRGTTTISDSSPYSQLQVGPDRTWLRRVRVFHLESGLHEDSHLHRLFLSG